MIDNITFNEIVASLNIGHLPLNEQQVYIDLLEEEISERVNIAIIEQLNEEQRALLLELASAEDELNLQSFLLSTIPDFPEFVKKIAQQVVAERRK